MINALKSTAKTALAALLFVAPPATVVMAMATPAFAEKGGNASRGNNSGNANRASNGRGAIASELKGLNAAHASATGMANASPDSMPGKLYAYQQSTMALEDSVAAVDEAGDFYDALAAMTEERFNELNPDLDYAETLQQAATAYNDALNALQAAQTESEASLFTLTGGRELSDSAMAELQTLLGL